MNKRLMTLLTLLLCFSGAILAQGIRGTVFDETDGQPLQSVTVLIKGTTVGVFSDADGRFTISAKRGDLLVFTLMGFKSQEVMVVDETPLSITMEIDQTYLEEVVVVGYGTQKKSDITGSVASFNTETLEKRPVPNLISALQGSVPGLRVELYGSNAEGSNNSTIIRGSNSINASNKPIIILDGSPYYFSWSELNPDDIESIEVLKDASSSAIYGSRGANGVILITTKKGEGERERVNYHGYVTTSTIYQLPEMLDGDAFYYYKNLCVGDFTLTERNSFLSKDYVDWVGLALRPSFNHNHTLSLSGKGSSNNHYISLNLTDNMGIAKGDNFSKLSARLNFEQRVGKWITFGTNTQINYVDRGGLNVDFRDAYYLNPLSQNLKSDGSIRLETWEYTQDCANPLAILNAKNNDIRRTLITSNYLDIKLPVKGLSYRLNSNISFDSRQQQTYYGRDTYQGSRVNGQLALYNSYSQKWLLENIVSYERTFGKHNLFLTSLYSAQHEQFVSNSLTGVGFANDVLGYWGVNKAETLTGSAGETTVNHISQMFRANYSYQSRYLATFTVRRDGFSGFGEDRKYGLFPSLALGWNLVKESWIEESSFGNLFNQFKIRASWG